MNGRLCFAAFVLFACSGLTASFGTEAHLPFTSPFDVAHVRETWGRPQSTFKCPKVARSKRDLTFRSRYDEDDETKSEIEPENERRYLKAVAPLRAFERRIGMIADEYVLTNPPDPRIADCALKHLFRWAEKDALLGKAETASAHISRAWLLASASIAYTKFDGALRKQDPKKAERIESWLHDLAIAVKHHYTDDDTRNISTKNNHLYWAAWAVTATGVALQTDHFFDWGLRRFSVAMDDATEEGFLPLELRRGPRALEYHVYALGPLVMLAETAARNGLNYYNANDGRIHRIVETTLTGLSDPRKFEIAVGVEQHAPETIPAVDLYWLAAYDGRFGNRVEKDFCGILRDAGTYSARVGGYVDLYFTGEGPSDCSGAENDS
jgi:poly(beta-D-mannuronate) lyase